MMTLTHSAQYHCAICRSLALLIIFSLIGLSINPSPAASSQDTAMVKIPAGTYPIGSESGGRHARPSHSVHLDTFLIDKYEVTNEAFVDFLNSFEFELLADFPPGRLKASKLPKRARWLLLEHSRDDKPKPLVGLGDGDSRIGTRDGQFVIESGYRRHPVNEVTWSGAVRYCQWHGAQLPSEVQWEAAARGLEGRKYPWGDTAPTDNLAVFDRYSNQTDPVGAHPEGATPRGAHDMAGNVAEWTISLFRPYPYDRTDGRESMAVQGERVTRGGDHVFDSSPSQLTGYFRDGFSRDPNHGHRHIGFRCIKTAVESG